MKRVLIGAIALTLSSSAVLAQGCGSYPNTLTNGQPADATQVMANFSFVLNCVNSITAPRGYLSGVMLSTAGGSANFTVSPGVATSSNDNAPLSLSLTAALTKTTAPWAAGQNAGALDVGTLSSTPAWYHVFLIGTAAGVVDVLFSASATAPTLPSTYVKFRRIGAMRIDGSGHWTAFSQQGDEFLFAVPVNEKTGFPMPTTATLLPLMLPTGVKVWGKFRLAIVNPTSSAVSVLVQSPDETSAAASGTPGNEDLLAAPAAYTGNQAANLTVRTDTSGSIRWSSSPGSATAYLNTIGWIDRRGRDD